MIAAGWELRPMTDRDVTAAVALLRTLDEDDADEAATMYDASLTGHFVLGGVGEVRGVTGAVYIENTDAAFSLGPTHVADDVDTVWLGRMVRQLTDMLAEDGGRKLFAEISDYVDPEDGDIYRDLRRSLADLGFAEEGRIADYYAPGESQTMYGLPVGQPDLEPRPAESIGIKLTDIDELEDADGAYWLNWEVDPEAEAIDASDFQKIVDQVRHWDGRLIVIGVPSTLPMADAMMRGCGMQFAARLIDLYDWGVDQIRFVHPIR